MYHMSTCYDNLIKIVVQVALSGPKKCAMNVSMVSCKITNMAHLLSKLNVLQVIRSLISFGGPSTI